MQSRPPFTATFTFWRERVLVPPPHVAEHCVQLFQPPHWQSTGHGSVLHEVTACAGPSQAAPPFACFTTCARSREVVPLPHVREQAVQPLHSPHLQSTGQPLVLQVLFSVPEPSHRAPPKAAFWIVVRVLVMLPEPQVFVQDVQDSQLPHLQSTAQPWMLHASSSLLTPMHCFPPQAAGVWMARERVVTPPPQLTLQFCQLLHCVHLQSTGQPAVLQVSSSFAEPEHGLPPYLAGLLKRVRDCRPPPQDLVQSDQLPHESHVQFTGQGCVLHLSVPVVLPEHSMPPCDASTSLWRLCERSPEPQVLEQGVQVSQDDHLQFTGHEMALHDVVSFFGPSQSLPP
mmetsp:Transcript_59249/g.184022  ORF Transcript_59249/g.184022 Transcript_59249/m.184022 type:complete len:342 (-) Transcript_59249:309-1334(-)